MPRCWGMWPVERPVPLRAGFLLLGIWALLAPVLCFQGHPLWRYSSSEVVVPKKEVQHGKSFHFPGHVSYSLRFGGQRHMIHLLRKKLMWPKHVILGTQDDQGALQMNYPYFPEDCHFIGYIEDVPLSTVTLETCSGGLEGVMMLDNLLYEISPLKDSNRFEHIVSQLLANKNAIGPMYSLDNKEALSPPNYSAEPRVPSYMVYTHHAMLRNILFASHSMYRKFNNITKCAEHLIRILNVQDSFYHAIDFRSYVMMVIIYNEQDPMSFENPIWLNTGTVFHGYYANNFFTPYQPTSSVLLVQERPHESEFDPLPFTACREGSVVFSAELDRPVVLLAVIWANLYGRMIGMSYDSMDACKCQRRNTCIMYRYPGITDSFSNCSYVHLHQIIGTASVNLCYFKSHIEMYNTSILLNRCGNYKVEGKEQCDCGTFKECYVSSCCSPDCRFTAFSSCDTGACCFNCSNSPMTTLCRTVQNVCDLPEYCTGSNNKCPQDYYLQDGTPCSQEGYCYQGNCTDRSMHCKEIFGQTAHDGDDQCYSINTEKFRFGHCSREEANLQFVSCAKQDQRCGRLQCENVTRLPILQEHVSFHQSNIGGYECFGLDEHRGTATTDTGRVRTGTPCGGGKMCVNNTCSALIREMGYDCTPEKCSHRGVCNNAKKCYCHAGWEPPKCDKLGFGGSMEGGKAPKTLRKVGQNEELIIYLRVMYGRLYLFIAVLLIGYALNAKSVKTITEQEE